MTLFDRVIHGSGDSACADHALASSRDESALRPWTRMRDATRIYRQGRGIARPVRNRRYWQQAILAPIQVDRKLILGFLLQRRLNAICMRQPNGTDRRLRET